ncbi:MAG: protein kinase domain-containing protein [Allosphingosinicella sp.]
MAEIERYQIQGQIGEGGMQKVYIARDILLEKLVALKVPKNESAIKRFERSAQMSARVNNRNVAKTLDYVDTDEANFLVEELVDGMDLSAVLANFPHGLDPYVVARAIHHIALGLAASHAAGVVHRDLKPSNIMVAGGIELREFKVTDFGIAKMAEAELDVAVEGGEESLTASQTALGALPYMSPEMIASVKDASFPTDIWSIGAMAYELLSSRKPFGSGLRAVSKIERGEYNTSIPQIEKWQFKPLGMDLLKIIKDCLQIGPAARPTAADIVDRCEELCYNEDVRSVGVVNSFKHRSWGFITGPKGKSVFFHRESIYGRDSLSVGDRVLYAAYLGGGSDRAFPVVPMVPAAQSARDR